MVYGTSLRLPGAFFTPSSVLSTLDTLDYVSNICSRHVLALHVLHKGTVMSIKNCQHAPMSSYGMMPYDGPYLVVKRTDKFFTIDINGRTDTVSLDRLKPAHLDTNHDMHITPSSNPPIEPQKTTSAQPARVTRSGRHVHWPKHLSSNVS